ncbi:MAG: UPF0149 family protein [Rubrivivax sp.]|nr:UPF0149 family protein [Rubrivivax sp.]
MNSATDDEVPPPQHPQGAAPAADDREFEAFARTCGQLEGFDRMLNPFHVDGWLTAMVAGPVRLPTEQWLELLCGDAFTRAFADPAAHGQALATLEARVRTLTRMLDAEALATWPDQLRLRPYFDDWNEDEARELGMAEGTNLTPAEAAEQMIGGFWAEGFFIGLDTLQRHWGLPERGAAGAEDDIGAAIREICEPIDALIWDPDGDDMQRYVAARHGGKPPARDVLLDDACFAVQDLRLFLLDHGPRPEPRRVEAKPGRNDPCPCGSGRKYKKCHGLNE